MQHQAFQPHPEIAQRFEDLHPPFARQAATIEANRCLNCFDAPCTAACPTHIDVPRFIKKISSDNVHGSATTILEANILGASCARVCPVDVLCEGACVMHRLNEEPIQIGRLQRHAMDYFYKSGRKLSLKVSELRPEKIACIGAGPASLACAAELQQHGFQVTVFDRKPLAGGLNTYGVAEYKLRSVDSLREVELVRSLGVNFEVKDFTSQADLEQLEADFKIIFLGVGLGPMRKLNIPGENHPKVVDALEFISSYKTGGRISVGSKVVVIGAGNTAIDAANAAKRLGAEEVHVLYRREERDISAFSFEYENAKRAGIQFHWNTIPVAVHHDDMSLASIECAQVWPSDKDEFRKIPSSSFHLECHLLIPAIGQAGLLEFLSKCRGVELAQERVVVERATGQTANPRYFAGGDCVNGGREVVDAVADGKRAAIGIANVLQHEAAYA
ncbi:Pyridine nucleotide-disulfide oxidoreductase associated with reductive pyrimidine catabolism [Acidisarcina polymorpha]|uniref:Pyridine nucleotide-disulfide oxidoreductase associated with reductive pyrimidine catabolism n=1 Tax=Acidisarcina polymorpha TaxID=2211140 RepID=A0A2Z5G704_9BACT|nr:NAD(P)-dependent oxidoreductase [Acidisarcina polymorpha]AXC14336.1 Pyridine nucleotide-disulfide oxidoreductase associated with reductive pyrimidine catabolism [Acidisarcina polymorpha]